LHNTFPQRPNLPDQYIAVDGFQVRYVSAGSELPLVLIHGLNSSIQSWMFSIEPLAEHHEVFALDLPGFGLSERPRDFRIPKSFCSQRYDMTCIWGQRFHSDRDWATSASRRLSCGELMIGCCQSNTPTRLTRESRIHNYASSKNVVIRQ